ncbi:MULTISPECIES: cation diffusion facilitator family transporter [unclassified Paracoccus (in: a-proteobacteria)]|uniref:cation diffusion facilitator family transporter n=1 Tax=unclassified Paracoccus (in: a-proteobacteria) TaxID=2688777 RepID=UPI0012B3D000|nr:MULTISPECIES: cation diffusion facilitator family transporter [unclassified Paracoccus (in: a-proteobacteria)]UXU76368.1 cation diffusion facilitator family transporter [Paracoccus sp. SMMA_5]UXU82294.1 cation diffusion facilitator family transporter [Paracoccus sp. SMMA_5_TC]
MAHSHAHHRHDHDHGHSHMPGGLGDRAILLAVVVNLALTLAQVLGGWIADSTALIADGVHNLSDALALVLAFGARRLARRPASPQMSFGWGRAEVLAAFVNYLALIAVSIWLAVESVNRLIEPPQVQAGLVMALAGLALVIDLATAALVWRAARSSINIRAAFLHNLADAAVSVAVIVGGVLIWAFDWRVVDPFLTLLISAVIVWHCWHEIGPVIRVLMLGAPAGADPDGLLRAVGELPGVVSAHHLHMWQIDERRSALSLHLVVDSDTDTAATVRRVKAMLRHDFGIDHATIETEQDGQPCSDQPHPAAAPG